MLAPSTKQRPTDLIPLAQAQLLIPPLVDGRPPHAQTLKRWIRRGHLRGWLLNLRGVKYRRLFVSRADVEALVSAAVAPRDTAATLRAIDLFFGRSTSC